MEYLYGTTSSISRDLVRGTINELRYPCCFNNLVKDVEKEESNLIATRDGVRDRVAQAKKQTKKTAEVVDKWLKDANNDIDNVEELLKKARTRKSCCVGHCPNWIWRYFIGKKLAKKKRDLKTYIDEGRQYIQLERPASLPGNFSSEKSWEFESRKFAYEKLMSALEDEEVSRIGLYGMGGCGKTMLAMEVRKRANHLFDQVLFVPVSSTVEVQRIQDKIAGSLEFEFQEKDEMDRSQRLCMRLTQEDRILVILDDVWQMLDFDAIGIPSPEHHKGCKVLITTRSEAVCTLMDCQKTIHLIILTNDEAWDLFQKQALISEGTSIVEKHLAKEISDECKGLPVAIAAVASSLKGKAEVEWKVALDRLRSSKPINIEKGLTDPYKCLQLSYDNLDIEEAKSLFLLCSVFPEDCEIPIEFLTKSAIGLGIVGEIRSYEGARNEVSAAKNKLVSSCLLLDANEGKCVKMHDVVRDVAHWIAANENKMIGCALEKDVSMEHNSIKYLWCEKFSNDLDCSNLEFLYLHTYLEVSDGIFKGMRMLRVLFLYNKARYRRPLLVKSLKSLKNLRCILLCKWELGDISFVGDIKKLESLTLHDCSFLELPDVLVTQLANLRLLDLSECDMKRNPFEVIGRHSKLEELYFVDHRSKWDLYNEHGAEFFQKFRVSQALQRYHIEFGITFASFQEEFLNRHRTLFLSYLDASNAALRDLAEKAEVLCLANIEGGAKNIIPDIFQIKGGMYHLMELLIRDSEEIECLVDTSHHFGEVGVLLSKLHGLRIEHMRHLGALCHGSLPPRGHFERLKDLYLSHCPKLTCLFTLAVAEHLLHLEKLEIISCPGLKHVLADDDKDEISTDDKRLLFPKLKRLHVRDCDLEYLIPITFAHGLVQLECLEIVCNSKLKYVFGQCINGDQLAGQNQNELKIELTALEELTLIILPEIISICPEVCYLTWPSLRRFSLQNCPGFSIVSINTGLALYNNQIINEASHLTVQNIKEVRVNNCELEGIIQLAELSIDGKQDPLTSCLEILYLENLPQLRYICKGDIQSMNLLQNLQQMEVSGCRKLKSIFSTRTSKGLPQLKVLKIENCNKLEQIIEDKERQNSGSFNLPSLTRLTLKSCPSLGSLFTTSIAKTMASLEELMIQDCHGLMDILICDFQRYRPVFPSLKKLSIMRCQLLQYIFPVSFAKGLVQLETIEIRETHKLRYVFGPNIRSSHQYQNKFQIEFPVLEKVALHSIPNMISICPKNYHATCSSLQLFVMNDVGLSTLSINNLTVDSEATYLDHGFITDSWATSMTIKQKLVSVIIENNSKIEEIFHLDGFPINRQQLTLWVEVLKLINLSELRYIWIHAKHFVSLQGQHLTELHICNCPKLKAIFSASVLRMLPLLKILAVEHCDELEKIIEDDKENENASNAQSPKVCFSQLNFLLVTHCNNLKHLFFISIPYEFPKLEYLILNQDSHLVQVFEGETGGREGRVEVLLPKLKHVVLMQLPNLTDICQGMEFQTMINLFVDNCPKFSLTSTTTVEDMLLISNSNKEIDIFLRPHLLNISGIITKGHEVLTSNKENKGTQDLQSGVKKLPLIPLQNLIENIGDAKTTIIGEILASAIPASASMLSKPSLTSSTTCLYKMPLHNIEDIVKDSIQKGDPLEEIMNATLSAGAEGASLDGVVVAYPKHSGRDMVQDSQVVKQGDRPNESMRGTSPCHKIQNVDDSIQEGSNLINKEIEIGVISNDCILAQRNEEPEKEFVAKVSTSKIPAMATSLTNSELVETPSPSYLDIPHKLHLNNLVDKQPKCEPCLMNQQKPLGESKSTIEIPQSVNRVTKEGIISKNANKVALPMHFETASSQSGQLVTSQCKSYAQSEIMLSQTETYTTTESEDHCKYIQDFGTDDLISLFQHVEEDGEGQITTSCVPVVAAIAENHSTKDDLVVKALSDLEECLKMPLKDIASSEAYSLCLLTTLNFLSNLPLKDVTLSYGLEAIINSMHKEFPSILCSFKQALATTNKLTVLEAHRNEVAITLDSKISVSNNFMNEAQQKEAILKERIIMLEKEIKDCEAELSYLQEEKKKCIVETSGYKKDIESVRKDKSQMLEDQRNVRQELFEVGYKWSALCSQFEHHCIVARNPF